RSCTWRRWAGSAVTMPAEEVRDPRSSHHVPISLRAEDLAVGYPGAPVLHNIDLTLEPGRPPIGVVGPSGVGKTTLVQALQGRIKPDSGRLTWGGTSVHRLSRKDKRRFHGAVRAVSQYL